MTHGGTRPGESGFDVETPFAAVALCERPVVALTAWLTRALVYCAGTGRILQLVTPPASRLTVPLVAALRETGARWVVYDPDRRAYYDGMCGVPMRFDDGAFRHDDPLAAAAPGGPEPSRPVVATAYAAPPPPTGRHLRVRLEVKHEANSWTRIGGPIETLFQTLTGRPPAGWGPVEPVDREWRTTDLTRFCREEVPTHSWVTVTGPGDLPAMALLEVTRVADGVQESIDVTVGYPLPDQPPLDELAGLTDRLAGAHQLSWLYAETCLGRLDLTRPAHAEGIPLPIALAIGPGVTGPVPAGTTVALPPRVRIGPAQRPTDWYQLSRGDSPAGWEALIALLTGIKTGTSGLT